MALFFGQPCPLCGAKMTTEDRRFATSQFLGHESDLWRFSDAVMHWDCYAHWEHRSRFARMYFDAWRGWSVQNPCWGVAHSDERVLVSVNPDKLVGEVDVRLAETGSGFRISLDDWADWLEGGCFEECNHEVEREALAGVLPLLRSKLPTAEAIVGSAGMSKDTRSRIAAAGGIVARISHELACQKLAERAASKGVACPRCGRFSSDHEYVRIEPLSETGPQSHLVCYNCGKEFGPENL